MPEGRVCLEGAMGGKWEGGQLRTAQGIDGAGYMKPSQSFGSWIGLVNRKIPWCKFHPL